MNASSKSRALLLGAVVAVTTPALAYYYYAPVAEEEEITAAFGPPPPAEPAVTIAEAESTSEPAIPPAEPTLNVSAPAEPITTAVQEPPVTVYGERKTKDELINEDVVKLLANDTRLSGYIGVETRDAIVTLNGRVTTAGQTWHATRVAQSVEGVREVRNHLRAKVGGMS